VCLRCFTCAQYEKQQQRRHLLEEVASPSTSIKRLEALFALHPKDKELRSNLVKNPNVSLEIFLALSLEFPQEAAQNIAQPLLLLEAPDLSQRQEAIVLEAISRGQNLKRSPLSSGALLVLSRSPLPKLRALVVRSSYASHEILESMMHDPSPLVRAALASACQYPDILLWLSSDPDSSVRRAVALNRRTSREIRREIVRDDSSWRNRCNCEACLIF
jgi:hypothetical protein